MKSIEKLIYKNINKFKWERNDSIHYTYTATLDNMELWFFNNSDYCGHGFIIHIDSEYVELVPLKNSRYDYYMIAMNKYHSDIDKIKKLNIFNRIKCIIFNKEMK